MQLVWQKRGSAGGLSEQKKEMMDWPGAKDQTMDCAIHVENHWTEKEEYVRNARNAQQTIFLQTEAARINIGDHKIN